jgi:PKHD-type hydroxylase
MKYSHRILSTVPKKKLKNNAYARLRENDKLVLPQTIPKLFTPEECDRIIDLSNSELDSSGVVGEIGVDKLRDSRIKWLFPDETTEWIFARLDKAAVQANKSYNYILSGFFQGVQIATYIDGGHYGWHIDIGKGNQSTRKLSISVQLSKSEDYEGGDLEFMMIKQKASRIRGDATIFPSFLVHKVNPVTTGTRISMVSWVGGDAFT